MKTWAISLVLFLVSFCAYVSAQSYDLNQQGYYIFVYSPSPGEVLEAGGEYTIEWSSSPDIGSVNLFYTLDDIEWNVIRSCIKNTGRYDWIVPDTRTEEAKIMVQGLNNCNEKRVLAEEISGNFIIDSVDSDPCTCFSCKDCSEKLKSSCSIVYLSRDISSKSDECISASSSHKVFDCRNHRISGKENSSYALSLSNVNDFAVKNCELRGLSSGIKATDSFDIKIINNKIVNNEIGVLLSNTKETIIQENIIEGNNIGAVFNETKKISLKKNRICGSFTADIYVDPSSTSAEAISEKNVCDFIYNWNNNQEITWCEETCTLSASAAVNSGLELQNALKGNYGRINLISDISAPRGVSINSSHVTILCNGHRIRGVGSGVGVSVKNKVDVELSGCVIENFDTGLLLEGTSYSRINSNTIRNNRYGLVIADTILPSRKNTVTENYITKNEIYGLYLSGAVEENRFEKNVLDGGQYSLYTAADCNNIFSSNIVDGSGLSILYLQGSQITASDNRYGEIVACNLVDGIIENLSVLGDGKNGIIVKDSRNLLIRNTKVKDSFDCILVMNSSDVALDAIDSIGCRNGILSKSSERISIRKSKIMNNTLSGIYFASTNFSTIESNVVGGRINSSGRGIVVEGSHSNSLKNNLVEYTHSGISLDALSRGNSLLSNILCGNGLDLLNQGYDNRGSSNKCNKHVNWFDDNVSGCSICCNPPADDINNDGIDDACDCYDAYTGPTEKGVDCGGRCRRCIECSWCGPNIEPIRITGRPNEGKIDVVFVPHENFRGNVSLLREEALKHIREHYLRLIYSETDPLDSLDKFNFYIYLGGSSTGVPCVSLLLPGEREYINWLISCSTACSLTSGLGCSCFLDEPKHFYGEAGWADVVVVLASELSGCSNALGPPSYVVAGDNEKTFLHETGHAFFGLVDDYTENTTNTSSAEARHRSCMLPEDYAGECSFSAAALDRIQHTIKNYPSSNESKGILIYIKQDAEGMKKLGVSVSSGYPDLGLQEPIYWVEVFSASADRILGFGLWDYRKTSKKQGLMESTYVVNIPFRDNPRWVNFYNASSGKMLLSVDLGPELYGWCSTHFWNISECMGLDIDDNSIPDYFETSSWIPKYRIKERFFSDRSDLAENINSSETKSRIDQERYGKHIFDSSLFFLLLILAASFLVLSSSAALFLAAFIVLAGLHLKKEASSNSDTTEKKLTPLQKKNTEENKLTKFPASTERKKKNPSKQKKANKIKNLNKKTPQKQNQKTNETIKSSQPKTKRLQDKRKQINYQKYVP